MPGSSNLEALSQIPNGIGIFGSHRATLRMAPRFLQTIGLKFLGKPIVPGHTTK